MNSGLIVGGFVAFVVTVAAIYILNYPARVLGLMDYPCRRKRHMGTVPLTGGLAITAGVVAGAALVPVDWGLYWSLPAGMVVLMLLGIADDRHRLRAVPRLLVQLAVAMMIVLAGVKVGWLGNPWGSEIVGLGAFSILFTVLAVAFLINAINMMDGMDGLSGGIVFLALAGMLVLAFSEGMVSKMAMMWLLWCALAAFLLFNLRFPWRPRGLVFLGDSGSMLLGFALAWFAVSLAGTPAAPIAPITVVWFLIIPAADSLAVIIRRLRRGRSPLAPDRTHLHHILLRSGFSVRGAWAVIMLNQLAWVTVAVGCHLGHCSEPRQFFVVSVLMLGYVIFSLNARHFIRARLRAVRTSGTKDLSAELG